jgi:hypothetical protein
MWLIAALLMGIAIKRYFSSVWFAIFTYLYVLWNPFAFDAWLGLRTYRNSLFPPLFFIFISLIILLVSWRKGTGTDFSSSQRTTAKSLFSQSSLSSPTRTAPFQLVCFGAFTSIFGFFTFFLYAQKEDMAWIIPVFIFAILYKIFMVLRSHEAKGAKAAIAVICLIPILTFSIGNTVYKSINEKYFGVALLNTRTQGELSTFVNNVYQVENDQQTTTIWAPATSIEAVFSASPTLRSQPKMLYDIEHVIFAAPDIRENPLKGDFLTWQLRIAISDTLGWKDEAQIQNFFAKVNKEIDDAFVRGTLHRTKKITLVPSLVPRSPNEIRDLIKPSMQLFLESVLPSAQMRLRITSNDTRPGDRNLNYIGLKRLNIDPSNPNPVYFSFFQKGQALSVARTATDIFTTVNFFLLIALGFSLYNAFHRAFKKHSWKAFSTLFFAISFLLYGLAYCFATQWFAEFLNSTYVSFFYACGAAMPFVTTGLLFGVGYHMQTLQDYFSRTE